MSRPQFSPAASHWRTQRRRSTSVSQRCRVSLTASFTLVLVVLLTPAMSCRTSGTATLERVEPSKSLTAAECNALRPQTEPELLGWDSGSRSNLRALSTLGLVAVRYEARGCDVRLEVVPNCVGRQQYEYQPHIDQDSRILRNPAELYNQVPLGAAPLQARMAGGKALRADYRLVGVAAAPPGRRFTLADLSGSGCESATHVVSLLYLGGFSLVAGTSEALEASGGLFAAHTAEAAREEIEPVSSAGIPAACDHAQRTRQHTDLCSVPLRIALAPLDALDCPQGTKPNKGACVKEETEQPRCPNRLLTDPSCPEGMGYIPAGSFQMGSERQRRDELPVHKVDMKAFCMDRFEVTAADYGKCVRAGGCTAPHKYTGHCDYGTFEAGKPNHPINCVDWYQATAYCKWAGKHLPEEEEWEYAAKGPENRKYPWGDTRPHEKLVNICGAECTDYLKKYKRMQQGNDGWPRTAPVGSFPDGRSCFGIEDMAGNVGEWTASGYSEDYNSPRTTSERVNRGESFYTLVIFELRVTRRFPASPPTMSYDGLGFRCAK